MLGLGILGIGAVKLSRNPWIRSAGFSALSIAGFDFGRVNLGGVKGYLDGDSAGGGKGSGQGPY
jgi:hypothetical protein